MSLFINDFDFKMGKSYHPQVFLEECTYIVKEIEVIKRITEDIEFLLMNLVSLMKRKCLKKFHKHEKFALCKLLPSLNYTLTIPLTIF